MKIPEISFKILILGGGIGGLSLAKFLWQKGEKNILLVDREVHLGGPLSHSMSLHSQGSLWCEEMENLCDDLFSLRIPISTRTEALEIDFENRRVLISSPHRGMEWVKVQKLVLATGGESQGIPDEFSHVFKWGIFTDRFLLQILHRYGICPGKKIFFWGSSLVGREAASRLSRRGFEIVGMADSKIFPEPPWNYSNDAIPVYSGCQLREIKGIQKVEGVVLRSEKEFPFSLPQTLGCDTFVLAQGEIPEIRLIRNSPVKINSQTQGIEIDSQMRSSLDWIYALGDAVCIHVNKESISQEAEILSHILTQKEEKVCFFSPGSLILKKPSSTLANHKIFTSMVEIHGGEQTVLPVRTSGEISLDLLPSFYEKLKSYSIQAPAKRGSVLVENFMDTGEKLIAASHNYLPFPGNSRILNLIHSLKEPRYVTALCAHRGDMKRAPENTLSAFQKSLELEPDVIEFDVHMTRDGEVVVIHDPDVDRTTNGKGKVKKFSLEEIKKLSAGEWFSEEFEGERIPTLRETLVLMKGKTIPLIEIKNPLNLNVGIEEKVFALLEEMDMLGQVMMSTRSLEYAVQLKTRSPKTWVLHLAITKKQMRQSLKTIIDGTTPYWRMVSKDLVEAYHRQGKIIIPWTVDSLPVMESLAEVNIDGIISNKLVELAEVLLSKSRLTSFNPYLWKQYSGYSLEGMGRL